MDFTRLKEVAFDDGALEAAEHNNPRRLADKLRDGSALTKEERNFIADRLEGKRKLKTGEMSRVSILDVYVLGDFMRRTEFLGDKKSIAIEDIAAKIGESEKSVRNRIARAQRFKDVGASVYADMIKLYAMHAKSGTIPKENDISPLLDDASPDLIDILRKSYFKSRL